MRRSSATQVNLLNLSFECEFVEELELSLLHKMNICILDSFFFVLDAEQQFNKLLVWRIVYSEGRRLIVFRHA